MGFIEYYVIFALTTSIFALIDVFIPILHEVSAEEVSNVLTENPKLSCLVYFCLTALMAPFVILPLVVPSMNIRFRVAMAKVVREQQ
jgi:hypothetical protein